MEMHAFYIQAITKVEKVMTSVFNVLVCKSTKKEEFVDYSHRELEDAMAIFNAVSSYIVDAVEIDTEKATANLREFNQDLLRKLRKVTIDLEKAEQELKKEKEQRKKEKDTLINQLATSTEKNLLECEELQRQLSHEKEIRIRVEKELKKEKELRSRSENKIKKQIGQLTTKNLLECEELKKQNEAQLAEYAKKEKELIEQIDKLTTKKQLETDVAQVADLKKQLSCERRYSSKLQNDLNIRTNPKTWNVIYACIDDIHANSLSLHPNMYSHRIIQTVMYLRNVLLNVNSS